MQILDGKTLSVKIIDQLKDRSAELKPCLAVVFVGDSPASAVYARNKAKACERAGIVYREFRFNDQVGEEEILNTIDQINQDDSIHGVIVQLPVPKQVSVPKILKAINPKKDVDGFTAYNTGKMFASTEFEDLPSATPGGIIRLLDEYKINVSGLNVVVIGRSNIVGKPIAIMLTNRSATVTICHSKTKDLNYFTKSADLIIAAVGIPKFLKSSMIKEGVVVIDVGINRDENGQLCGDVDFETVAPKCSYITPVPGGVGPMTIAQLMTNVVRAAE
jgi:methylenetetrahydrofolate dehydrogenase (NADP+) / methenyltetrahydrofolate cyclohydrolase